MLNSTRNATRREQPAADGERIFSDYKFIYFFSHIKVVVITLDNGSQ
jgi:hypothetical protein